MFYSPIPQNQPATLAQWVGHATGMQMKYLRAWAAFAVQAPFEQLRLTQAMIDSGQAVFGSSARQAPVEPAPEGAATVTAAPKAKPTARKTATRRKPATTAKKASSRTAAPRKTTAGKPETVKADSAAAVTKTRRTPVRKPAAAPKVAAEAKPDHPATQAHKPAARKSTAVTKGAAASKASNGTVKTTAPKAKRAPSKPPSLPEALAGAEKSGKPGKA